MLTEADLMDSPAWYPLRLTDDHRAIELLRLDESAYRAASFLDERLLAGRSIDSVCPVNLVAAAAAALPRRANYIFHTGHVGSTLISRLVGELAGCFSVREPALLRMFAAAPAAAPAERAAPISFAALLALFSRIWRPNQRSVIKLTSFLSEHAGALLSAHGGAAAVFVFAQPLNYLRGILAGDNSRIECLALAPGRLRRLVRRVEPTEWRFDPQSEGEVVAMSWLCEMAALQDAASHHRARILWVDFDAFLHDPVRALQAIVARLGIDPGTDQLEALVKGPIMQRYSKGAEFAYDAALRREVLALADRDHAAEISRGLAWLGQVSAQHPRLQALFA
jgi:hypothetical protein